MNIKTAPLVRQDTFIIESLEFDPVCESCLQHGHIVVPVIEEPPSTSRSGGHISRNNSSTFIATKENSNRSNITNEGKNQARHSHNNRLQYTVIPQTRLCDSPEFGTSLSLSSSVRKKLKRKQQTRTVSNTLSSPDLNREKSIVGDNSSHPTSKGKPLISATITPNHPGGRSERICVDNSKVRHTIAAGSSSDTVNFYCSNLGRKSQFGEGNIVSYKSLGKKVSQLGGCETIDVCRPATVLAGEIWPCTWPQTSGLQGVVIGGRERGSIGRPGCYSYHSRDDLAPNNGISNKLTGTITSLTPQEVTSRMARSDRFNDGQERFEDVLKERNDMLESERIYIKRIRQLEEELKGMVQQCQVLSNENKELRKTLDAIKKPDKNAENLAKITKLESEKANQQANHEAKLKQMDSLLSENAKLKNENAELERKLGELDKQLISLQYDNAQISDLQTAISGIKRENETLEDKSKSLECEKEALTNSLESKLKELDELTRALQTEAVNAANLKQTEGVTAANLKQTQEKLERTEEENTQIKHELADMRKMLTNSETMKQKLQEHVTEGEDKMDKLTLDIEKKDKMIHDLRSDLDTSRQDILKLEDSQQAFKDVEKEISDLRLRVGFLKADLDSSREENQRMQQDREEMVLTIEKIRHEKSAESGNESESHLRNWELEKELRVRIEADLVKKKEEAMSLEARLNEANNKVIELGKKIRYLEDKDGHLGISGLDELETDNKALKDGNMKLRQMLVERNIHLTNTKHEQNLADSLIQSLELKQKKAEVRVQQLSQRIGNASQNPGPDASKVLPAPPNRTRMPLEPIKNIESVKLSRSHIQERPEHRGRPLQALGPQQTTHPESQFRRHNLQQGPTLGRSTKLDGEEVYQAASGVSPLATKHINSPQSLRGYFGLYKVKQKRFHEKGY